MQMHLIILSRTDPPLATGRLRASAMLMELGVSELRFSRKEAETLLADLADKRDEEVITALLAQTEGWVAGLHLASLSLRSASGANY